MGGRIDKWGGRVVGSITGLFFIFNIFLGFEFICGIYYSRRGRDLGNFIRSKNRKVIICRVGIKREIKVDNINSKLREVFFW